VARSKGRDDDGASARDACSSCDRRLRVAGPRDARSMALACPRCSSTDVARSRRRGIEHVVGWLGARPYRCYACGRRFFAWTLHAARLGARIEKETEP
jgi:DNA-directed RNA polymerase subunit RPC12/RpoP